MRIRVLVAEVIFKMIENILQYTQYTKSTTQVLYSPLLSVDGRLSDFQSEFQAQFGGK